MKRPHSARRHLLLSAGSTLLLGLFSGKARSASVIAVRIWPASAYTRVTLEHDTEGLRYTTQLLTNPQRFVVDLEGTLVNPALRDLTARLTPSDPFIKTIRVGQYQPRTVRIVFELKQEVAPQVFRLPAIAQYQHRLVLDLYPTVDEDPLLTFLANIEKERAVPPAVARAPELRDPAASPQLRTGGAVAADLALVIVTPAKAGA